MLLKNLSDEHQAYVLGAFCSERELERGDREVWGSVGDNQIGIIHSAAMPVKYGYDIVLDNDADNEQVGKYTSRFSIYASTCINTDCVICCFMQQHQCDGVRTAHLSTSFRVSARTQHAARAASLHSLLLTSCWPSADCLNPCRCMKAQAKGLCSRLWMA